MKKFIIAIALLLMSALQHESSALAQTVPVRDEGKSVCELERQLGLQCAGDRPNEDAAPLTRGGIIIMDDAQKRAPASNGGGASQSCRLTFNIPFANGSAMVPPSASPDLSKVTEILRSHPDLSLTISGHTSAGGWRGLSSDAASDRNLTLSMDRAVSVRRRLLALGVAPGRIKAEGRGDTEPEVDGDRTDTRNRRVIFERIGCDR